MMSAGDTRGRKRVSELHEFKVKVRKLPNHMLLNVGVGQAWER